MKTLRGRIPCIVAFTVWTTASCFAAQSRSPWKVLSAETVPVRQAVSFISFDRTYRNPGDVTIRTLAVGIAFGITERFEGGIRFEVNRHVRVGRPEQLSFGQQALGFFGGKTPGSPPLPSELMPGSSRVPQLRSPPAADGALTGNAGYYNLLPFAGLVNAAGATGHVSLIAKYKIFSEAGGAPIGLAVHSSFDVPIHKGIDFLLTHPVGTADLLFAVHGIVSKNIGRRALLNWNAGYRHVSQPAHASVFRLSDELPLGVGFTIPADGRLQFIVESTAEVFIGPHTPNTSSGPNVPVDVAAGVRMHFTPAFNFSAGYQRAVNLPGDERHGFVVGLSYIVPLLK
jgi:hypothetical protein